MRAFRALGSGLIAFALLAPAALAGEGLSVRPGLWRARGSQSLVVTGLPPMPAELEETTVCVRDERVDPQSIVSEHSDCRVRDVVVRDAVITFRMTCPTPQGPMTGDARYETRGDRGKGRVEMRMASGALEARLTLLVTSERIGECKADA